MRNSKIKVKTNQRKRHFTIREYSGGELIAKYRIYKMSLEEFESAEYWTENDWFQFLKTDDYYIVSNY